MTGQVHYELFIRKTPASSWVLDQASEDRAKVLANAEAMIAAKDVAAVRVSKETLDDQTREFRSLVIFTKGAAEPEKAKKIKENKEPLCVSPSDLYSGHARERIGRLLDSWLLRNSATPFELLHRPDLAEKLDASGTDLQHAIQKIAIPEAQDRGISVHELIRAFQALVERSINRLIKDGRGRTLPDLTRESFADVAARVVGGPEDSYLLGAAVAAAIAGAKSWSAKVERLLDLADGAPTEGAARALALTVLEQPLAEILGSRTALLDILGEGLELGEQLSAMTRVAGSEAVEALIAVDPKVARLMPDLSPAAARLANWLDGPHFESVRTAIAKRVLRELTGPRRLKPNDAEGEIATLRALAMALTAAAGRVLSIEDVHDAFSTRSKMLVAGSFVESLLTEGMSAREEVEALIRMAENITGAANKRQACRWIDANVRSLRFEKDIRQGTESPTARLAGLASLQRSLSRIGLVEEDAAPVQAKLGELGGLIEADSNILAAIVRSAASETQKLNMLLRFATGEAGPLGPGAERARQEVMRMAKSPAVRTEMAASPEMMARMRDMMQAGALAA